MEPSAPSLREPFIPEDEVRMQNRVIQQQDANISALSDAVNNIHQTAGAIHSEVTEQNALLDDLDDGVGNTQRNLRHQQRRQLKLFEELKANRTYIMIIFFLIVMGGIIVVIATRA
eukprot:TRINITY_DN51982_c0_g1_i2.p2 TRINITY_DN51982_c0_g1~~TRINITY_DN51982_c0_g1_i2.p2  ORF type:complete len:116 (+),score=14.64 TRINITY_DN51982_c0_g1_i2:196-543(+)